jgi:predicted phage terminase large subunit-like protein
MPLDEKRRLLALLEHKERLESVKQARTDFLAFCHRVYPGFKEGPHHRIIAKLLKEVAEGTKTRLIINIAPRFGKSETISYLFAAFFYGLFPSKKIIMTTHTASLSESYGRRVRNLIRSPEYQEIFPESVISDDQQAAGQWSTTKGGQYYAAGVGGALAGRGADLLITDDPHALTLDTEVPTPCGFTTIGALRVGDEVYGPDGTPTRVIAKSPVWPARPVYEVQTDDGAIIEADAAHLWTYHSETNIARSRLLKTQTTQELEKWDKPNKPYLPRHAAVRYPERDLPVHPWALGAWLGDGHASVGRMTAHPDDAPYMRGRFEDCGYQTTDHADRFSFGVRGLFVQLRALGVADNKHIPTVYMHASAEQRMALLQGLMDTDGEVSKAGECIFHNKDAALVDQVVELLHSLGKKARRRSYYCDGKFGACWMHRVCFKLKDAALMPRKRERTRDTDDKQRRSITVTATDRVADMQCITVEREDGLFLVGREYVVTHNSEQDVTTQGKAVFEKAWTWYQTGPLQRLMPGGVIVVIMTRWDELDLTGRLLSYSANNPDADEWELVQLPPILPSGRSLWPEQWPIEQLVKKKNSMSPKYWNSQYMQDPVSEEGALLKREWWQTWEEDYIPSCEFIIMTLDGAFTTTSQSNFSAITVFGVFYRDDASGSPRPALILLDTFNERVEFPDLKKTALKFYKEWKPDAFVIEAKASGLPLLQELRLMGVPVQDYTPSRASSAMLSNDKVARVSGITDIFASGMVWAPDTRWAHEVIEQCAKFPNGAYDDLVDCVSMAMQRFRQGGFIKLPSDAEDDGPQRPRRGAYAI